MDQKQPQTNELRAAFHIPDRVSLMVDATNNCQLGCRYCYFGKKGHEGMDVNRVFAAICNFLSIKDGLKEVDIHYMGGEPLMAWNRILKLNSLVRTHLLQRQISFRWGMTSNLVALDEKKTEHMIFEQAGIHASIDGPAHIHNKNRPFKNGQTPSFDLVAKHAANALRISPEDAVRVTVCPEDAKNLVEIVDAMVSLGYQRVALFPAFNMPWTQTNIETWASYLALACAKYPNVISTVIKKHSTKCNVDTKFGYCGAGHGLWAFNIKGYLHFCHHFTNIPQLAVIEACRASPKMIGAALNQKNFRPDGKIPVQCLECSAIDYCGGGCWADNFLTSGNSSVPPKSECAIRVTSLEVLKGWWIDGHQPQQEEQSALCVFRHDECEERCQSRCDEHCQNRCEDRCERLYEQYNDCPHDTP